MTTLLRMSSQSKGKKNLRELKNGTHFQIVLSSGTEQKPVMLLVSLLTVFYRHQALLLQQDICLVKEFTLQICSKKVGLTQPDLILTIMNFVICFYVKLLVVNFTNSKIANLSQNSNVNFYFSFKSPFQKYQRSRKSRTRYEIINCSAKWHQNTHR